MYSVVLLAALSSGEAAPALHKRGHSASNCYAGHTSNKVSHGSYGACYGACYGRGYTGWVDYGGWGHPHAHSMGWPSPGGAPYGATAGWGAPYGSSAGWGAPYGSSVGWGAGYGAYLPGYACYGGCGGYAGFAYSGGIPPYAGTVGGGVVIPPAGGEVSKEAPPSGNGTGTAARLVVDLSAGAKLFVDGAEIKGGPSHSFRTPSLAKGQKYYYDLRVEIEKDGEIVSEKRRVVVTPGQTIRADFREMNTAARVVAKKR